MGRGVRLRLELCGGAGGCSLLWLNGGTAGGGSKEAMHVETIFWMYIVHSKGEEAGLQSCASGRAGTAAQGSTVYPERLGARVCCISAEQTYFADAESSAG
jgi:hypothetical protein